MSECDIDIKPNTDISELAQWVKVLCEPNRLLLLEAIINGIQCNCEIGKLLSLAPNLISHHLSVLRESGIIETERDPVDSRWIYYSVNQGTMKKLHNLFSVFFDINRIKPRKSTCGPNI